MGRNCILVLVAQIKQNNQAHYAKGGTIAGSPAIICCANDLCAAI